MKDGDSVSRDRCTSGNTVACLRKGTGKRGQRCDQPKEGLTPPEERVEEGLDVAQKPRRRTERPTHD